MLGQVREQGAVARLTASPARVGGLAARVAAAPKVAEGFYQSGAWRAKVAEIKRRRGAWCERCGSTKRLILDHIIERRDGGPDFDDNNLELLCFAHHAAKTAAARAARARGGAR